MIHSYKKAYKELLTEEQQVFKYGSMKQVVKDADKLVKYILSKGSSKESGNRYVNFMLDDAIKHAEKGSWKIIASREPKSVARTPRDGSRTRGRRNSGKLFPVISVNFYDTFWKKTRDLGPFYKVKDFNAWMNSL